MMFGRVPKRIVLPQKDCITAY